MSSIGSLWKALTESAKKDYFNKKLSSSFSTNLQIFTESLWLILNIFFAEIFYQKTTNFLSYFFINIFMIASIKVFCTIKGTLSESLRPLAQKMKKIDIYWFLKFTRIFCYQGCHLLRELREFSSCTNS